MLRLTRSWSFLAFILALLVGTAGYAEAAAPNFGAVIHVANLAALRNQGITYGTTVVRDGFAQPGDAPLLAYTWAAICPGAPDNLALYVAPNTGGAGCWSSAADPNRLDTREWGAINDSTALACGTDNASAFQNAINSLGSGARIYNAGPSCIKSQVTIAQPGQSIACLGGGNAGGLHDTGAEFTAPAPIVWGGSVGVTMFKYQSATTQASNGWGMNCALNGLGIAAYGVNSFSSRGGVWNIFGAHFTSSLIRADIDPNLLEAAGSSYNTYSIYSDERYENGAVFQCFTGPSNGGNLYDCSQDQFMLVTGVWNGQVPAMDFDGADTEQIHHVSLYNANVATGVCAIRFRAGATWDRTGRNNFVDYVGISSGTNNACPVYAEGTEAGGGRNVASNWNNVNVIDTATGGNTQPLIGTPGGTLAGGGPSTVLNMLWWGTNSAPYGYNYFTVNGATASQRAANGIITNRGVTGTVVHGTFQDVFFSAAWTSAPAVAGTQLQVPTACQSVALNPNQAAKVHAACVPGASTQLRVFNDDAAVDAAITYEVTGY